MHLISNKIIYDEKGILKSFSPIIVHSHNKEDNLAKYIKENGLKNGKNAMLIGDSIFDSYMAKYVDYEEKILVGYKNFIN